MPSNDTSSGGFLSGFVEASVEMPPDGLNGDCIVHYSGQYSNYTMRVKLLNGIREGEAVIVHDETPYLKLVYTNGVLTGSVERLNHFGTTDLKGQLVNGVESGVFTEYSDKEVMWRGYYRNGVRYSELTKSDTLDGYYDEKSVSSKSLLTTAQYDDSLHDKNGRCFEYENGSLKSECVYENGVKKRTIREFVNGKMVVFNSDGKKVYEGVYYGDMKSSFSCHEPMEGMAGFFKEVDSNNQLIAVSQYDEYNIYRNGKCFEMKNGSVKRVCLYDNAELKRLLMEFNDSSMTEYNESGKKVYEGEFKGDMKSGFVREGKGREYSTDGETALYSGEWKDGKRNGMGEDMNLVGHWRDGELEDGLVYEKDESQIIKRGCLYENGEMKRVVQEFNDTTMIEHDENGRKVYEGGFYGDAENGFVRNGLGKEYRMIDEKSKSISEPKNETKKKRLCCWVREVEHEMPEVELVPNENREEEVEGAWSNGVRVITAVVPSSLTSKPLIIKDLTIGMYSYNSVFIRQLKLSGLVRLKRIVVGNHSFRRVRLFELDGLSELESVVIGTDCIRIRGCKRKESTCRIVNCPKLKSIQIGDWSFSNYHSFELNSLPSLRLIDIGEHCFRYAPSFSLTGLIG